MEKQIKIIIGRQSVLRKGNLRTLVRRLIRTESTVAVEKLVGEAPHAKFLQLIENIRRKFVIELQ